MAGATPGEPSENPVPINVTAMVDIIFCLCTFFFCSFHFRQLEGKMESWLPDKGVKATPLITMMLEEVRIFVRLDSSGNVLRQVGSQRVGTDDDLRGALRGMMANYQRGGLSDVPVIIESDPQVPWREVVSLLSLCRLENLTKLEFASRKA